MLDNPFGEEIFPNIQTKPPRAQLEAIPSCPVTHYVGEDTDIHLATTSFQVVVERDKVSPQPPYPVPWAILHQTCALDPSPALLLFFGHETENKTNKK